MEGRYYYYLLIEKTARVCLWVTVRALSASCAPQKWGQENSIMQGPVAPVSDTDGQGPYHPGEEKRYLAPSSVAGFWMPVRENPHA